MKPEWVPKMAPANTFKKTEPGTAKVWEKSGHGLMIRLWSRRELPTNLFEEVGWREEQENVLRMKLMIDSKHSSQATNVLEAWGEIQEISLGANIVYYSIPFLNVDQIPLQGHSLQRRTETQDSLWWQKGRGPTLPSSFFKWSPK